MGVVSLAVAAAVMAWAALGCAPSGERMVTIGSQTYVCLVKNNAEFQLITPPADRYSRISSVNTYKDNSGGCLSDLYHIETMGVRSSFRKSFCDGTHFFPILTAIINVEMGVVQSVSWDDGCYFSPSPDEPLLQSCKQNAWENNSTDPATVVAPPSFGLDTGLTAAACTRNNDASFCNLAVYIAWTGRDANGNYFASAGRRFSIFRAYDLQAQLQAMELFLLNK